MKTYDVYHGMNVVEADVAQDWVLSILCACMSDGKTNLLVVQHGAKVERSQGGRCEWVGLKVNLEG